MGAWSHSDILVNTNLDFIRGDNYIVNSYGYFLGTRLRVTQCGIKSELAKQVGISPLMIVHGHS